MTEPTLKPCPWCGATPDAPWKSKTFGGWTIECECGMVVSPAADTADKAIVAWNRRAPAPIKAAPAACNHQREAL